MDYKDYQAGATRDFFWFRSKNGLIKILLKKLGRKNLKILNMGAGVGEDVETLSRFGDVYAIDIDAKALGKIPKKLVKEKRVCDATGLPYADRTFDLVVAFDVLEHIENDTKAMKEVKRVLKPHGHFVFTVPAFNWLYGPHDKMLNHHRRYTRRDMRSLLREFDVKELGYWMFSLFLPVVMLRLFERKTSKNNNHYMKLPRVVNETLYRILSVENWAIKHNVRLPVGITIYGICRRVN